MDLIACHDPLNYFDRPDNPKIVHDVFVKKRCIACHQVGGAGGVIGPSLDSFAQQRSPIFLAAAMWDHGAAMSEAMRAKNIARPTFTGSELEDLVAYLKSASSGQQADQLYILPGRPSAGRELFVRKRCSECHSVKGRGGRVGGDLAERRVQFGLGQFAAAMWNKAPAMMKEMKERNIPVPQVRAEEMADIVAYLYSVQYFARQGDPGRGEALARSRGCLSCHSIGGKGGNAGPDFKKVAGWDPHGGRRSAQWGHSHTKATKKVEIVFQWPIP